MLKLWGMYSLIVAALTLTNATIPAEERIEMIEQALNTDIDPCEDFYTYACANWQTTYGTDNYSDMSGLVETKFNKKFKELLKKRAPKSQFQNAIQKLKILYRSCLRISEEDTMNYFKYLKPGPGLEWPILESHAVRDENIVWNSENLDIFKLVGELHGYDISNVLVSVVPYRAEDGTLQIHFNLPELGEEDPNEARDILFVLANVGYSFTGSFKYHTSFMKVDSYWKQMYANYSTSEDAESMVYGELRDKYPNLWKLLEAMMPGKLSNDDEIFINNVDYYQFFNDYIVPPSEAQELVNYLFFKFLKYVNDDYDNDCIRDAKKKMDLAANFLYSSKYFLPHAEEKRNLVSRIIKTVYHNLIDVLNENHLHLRPSHLAILKMKISSIKVNVGNLPENVNEDFINNYYENTGDLDPSDYHQNHLKLLKNTLLNRLIPYENLSYSSQYFDSTGYDIYTNNVIIPFAYLEPPAYDNSYDNVLLWSFLGFFVSHEFAHSIDSGGLERDGEGYTTSMYNDIINNPMMANFTECLYAQNEDDKPLERTADAIGIKIAYRSYISETKTHTPSYTTSIPRDQLFFLNIAQFFCGNDEGHKGNLQQIVMNSNDFAAAFSCPVNSPMNPMEKCRLY
ncbi:neprilysin-1-like [Haematobia irritans]|uniref:neprilysin-1-like n=1 Tax=Haematobia irritans TaxID=7368 RepID=UPI003F508DF6